MNEVSCRAIEGLFLALESRGLAPEELVRGLSLSVEHLRDPSRRIDWDSHVRLTERVEELLGPDALDELSEHALHSTPLGLFRLAGLFIADTRHLYRLACRWMGPSFFTNVSYRYSELDDGRVQVDIEIPESYRPCPQFLRVTQAGLRALPRLLERGEAVVEADISEHRASYRIRAPRRITLLGRLRRLFQLPAAARSAFEEMERHQEQLNRALNQARDTHALLSAHVEQVATLDQLGRALLKQLSADDLPDRILEFLIQRFGWAGASMWLGTPGQNQRLAFFGRAGRTEGGPSRSLPLSVGDRGLGRLDVWGGEGADLTSEELLEKLLPWIAMTVLNARVASTPAPAAMGSIRWASQSGRDLFLVLDAKARILYAGPRPGDLLGYEQDDLLSREAMELVHPDDRPQLERDFVSLAQHSSSAIYASARMRQSDGSFRLLEGVVIKVLSDTGDDVYMISAGAVDARSAPH